MVYAAGMTPTQPSISRLFIGFSVATFVILGVSLALARDRFTWVLEVFPILLGFPVLVVTRRRFPLTGLLYGLLLAHFGVLALGGVYTYAEVPLGFWMQDWFGFARNHYDRIGHFFQGFVPAVLVREVLLRTSPLRAHRVVDRRDPGRLGGGLPGHPGGRLGRPVGHAPVPDRRHRLGAALAPRPRPRPCSAI